MRKKSVIKQKKVMKLKCSFWKYLNVVNVIVHELEPKKWVFDKNIEHPCRSAISIKLQSSRPGVFLGKGVLKICSKFTGEHPCRSAISIKLQSTLRHGCSPVNLLHIFRTSFPKNTSGRLLLHMTFLILKISLKRGIKCVLVIILTINLISNGDKL